MLSYLPLLAIAIFFLTPLVMLTIRAVRPNFAYHWLVAALGALAAWPVVALTRLELPNVLPLASWQVEDQFAGSLNLLVDATSWPFGVAIATLVLAVILTVVARQQAPNWRAWAGSLTLGGFGLLAVWAGNLLTLAMAWAALDLVEMLILFVHLRQGAARERVVVAFSARIGGILLLVWALMTIRSMGGDITFDAIPPQVGLYLLLAAGLRLGVLPLHVPFLQELPMRRGLGTSLRLVPAAASLPLLARVAETGVPAATIPYLLAFTALAALVGGGLWAFSADELNGRPFWILGMAALAVAAASLSLPEASIAWGITLIFSGGLLFLYSLRTRFLAALTILGLITASALPFTPLWVGTQLYRSQMPLYLIPVFAIAHALLLAGYFHHLARPIVPSDRVERWIWVIYPLGLMLLPVTLVVAQLSGWMSHPPEFAFTPEWWGGAAAVGGAALLWVVARRGPRLPQRVTTILAGLLSFQWLYRVVWGVYQFLGQLLAYLTLILEGEGGLLWAMVLLVVIVSLAMSLRMGG